MNALTRNIQIASFNVRNLLFAGMIILVIVALFFIPEIIEWRSGGETSARAPAATAGTQGAADPAEDELEESLPVASRYTYSDESPLEDVIAIVDSEGFAGGRAISPEASGQDPKAESQVDPNLFVSQNLTWNTLRSEAAAESMNRAQSTARTLLQATESGKIGVRFALSNFIAGVAFLQNDADKVMSPLNAARYLEQLDIAVAQNMQADNVARADYIKWMEVSLKDALANERAQRIKEQMLTPFDPRLRITRVDITYVAPPAGKPAAVPNTRLYIEGKVTGTDIKSLTLLRNGRFVTDIRFAPPDQEGNRWFYFVRDTAYGVWSFKAVDKKENNYLRYYKFLPKALQFERRGSSIIMPYDWQFKDPRIDTLFFAKEVKGPQESWERNYTAF